MACRCWLVVALASAADATQWVSGHCGETVAGEGAACHPHDVRGAWETSTHTECIARCTQCPRCAVVSFSRRLRDCSWFATCDTTKLAQTVTGGRSTGHSSTRVRNDTTFEAGDSARAPPDLFFSYSGTALDHSWLRSCPGFDALENSTATEKLGEVRLSDALATHPRRTRDPDAAALFFVPLWEYVSWAIGDCRGITHVERMTVAARELAASRHYQRHAGRDHVWGSTASTVEGATLNTRTGPLALLLRSSIVGRHKPFTGMGFSQGSVGGKCVIMLPFPAIASAVAAYVPPSALRRQLAHPSRTTLLFFVRSYN